MRLAFPEGELMYLSVHRWERQEPCRFAVSMLYIYIDSTPACTALFSLDLRHGHELHISKESELCLFLGGS